MKKNLFKITDPINKANDPTKIKENVEKMSDERSEVWGSMFGISKGTKITDQEESSFKSPYNPDGLTAEEYFNPAQCDKEQGRLLPNFYLFIQFVFLAIIA